jgi:hypothetical protein
VRTPVTSKGMQASQITYRDELGLVSLAAGRVRELGVGGEAVFSPDGARIAFARERQVWVMRANGADAHQVHAGFAPCFTPDSARLIVHVLRDEMTPDERATGSNASLVQCRFDGTEARLVGRGTLAGFSQGGVHLYAWESRVRPEDCQQALFMSPRHRVEHTALHRYTLGATSPGKIVLTGAFAEGLMGMHHAVGVSRTNASTEAELYSSRCDGKPARLLAHGHLQTPRFTVDGGYVLFIKDGEVCLVNVDGGDIAQITWGVNVDEYTLTPDGAHLLVFGRPRE